MNEPPAEMLCLKAGYERMRAERNWYKAMMERPDACARTVCPRKLAAEQEVEKLLAELGMLKMGFTPLLQERLTRLENENVQFQAERDWLQERVKELKKVAFTWQVLAQDYRDQDHELEKVTLEVLRFLIKCKIYPEQMPDKKWGKEIIANIESMQQALAGPAEGEGK